MRSCLILVWCTFMAIAEPYVLTTFPDTLSYAEAKRRCALKKGLLKREVAQGKMGYEEVGHEFEELIVNELIPYWYGVTWEFYGHTNTPDSGTIACGYFVSTTLKHMGFNLNRFTFAQQASLNEIKSLVTDRSFIKRYRRSKGLRETLIKELEQGLYMVGLDYHVGYILRHKEEVYFIHSSYRAPVMVVIEELTNSPAFWDSQSYYIAPISTDPMLMKKWLDGTKIPIVVQ